MSPTASRASAETLRSHWTRASRPGEFHARPNENSPLGNSSGPWTDVLCDPRSLRHLAMRWSRLHHRYRKGRLWGLYGNPIPKVVHQTYGLTPNGFETLAMDSWARKHLGFEHVVWSDESGREFVASCIPSMLHLYDAAPLGIMRSDMLRYLLLLVFGGIWSDADAQPLRRYQDWLAGVDGSPSAATTTFMAAVEADSDTWQSLGYVRRIQMAQWTMAAAPGHPVIQRVVQEMVIKLESFIGSNPGRTDVTRVDVLNTTGPGVWTDSIAWELEQRGHSMAELQHIRTGKRLGDLVFLPVTAFSPGVGVGAGSELDIEARVRHWFLGSWKKTTVNS